jgi:CRP-like cAMP-binding protein
MQPSKIKVQDFLARLPLFSDMTPQELDQIAIGTTEKHIQRGVTLFQRGDPCVGFHLVVYGQIKLAFVSSTGVEKVVEIIGPGHSFGEAVMFMEKPYIVAAQALADTLLLHVAKATVFNEVASNPQFAHKMLAGLSRRMHGLICDVEAYSLSSGTQRVIGYLLEGNAREGGDQCNLQVSKTIIASRLNLTPEHFSRILHDLSEKQLICVNGRNVQILDIERLRAHEG